MSAKLPVRFFASSLSVFDDAITVITEEDAFQVINKNYFFFNVNKLVLKIIIYYLNKPL